MNDRQAKVQTTEGPFDHAELFSKTRPDSTGRLLDYLKMVTLEYFGHYSYQ